MKIKTFVQGMIETNCYLVCDEKKNCVLIDCEGRGEVYTKYIEENKLHLKGILLTHGHCDHFGAVNKVIEKYPVDVYIGKEDEELLDRNQRRPGEYDFETVTATKTVKDKDVIQVGDLVFHVLHTPGHTKGGVCYQIENVIFSGDTLFANDCGRVDLYGGDWESMKASLKRLRDLEGDYIVYPGHGPSTTMEAERKNNQYMNQ